MIADFPVAVFAVATILLLGYELAALSFRWPTITDIVRKANAAWPVLPFLAGLVIGGLAAHFLWIPC